MCSIAGSHDLQEVLMALSLMKHRAPDGCGVSVSEFNVGMGRLAILDVENQEFPMTREDHTLVFNGEIYNYKELREQLMRCGREFTTGTDTEVLLQAYLEWGTACLDKLNGMFAFAIRLPNDDVFAARDLAGEKPFYYSTHPFRFASEAKAIGNPQELPHGYMLWYRGGNVHLSRWFIPRSVDIPHDFNVAVDTLEALLEDSVRLRTQADVPYGLYLSDGVDSNLLQSFHRFAHTFTYVDAEEHRDDFYRLLPDIAHKLDFPVASFSAYGLYKLASQAKGAGVKVVLSGEGADELFGGYVRYVPNEFNRKARMVFPSYDAVLPYRNMMQDEFHGNMQELLRMGDRMASAHGVENRCPFLDRRIVEYAWSLPMEWKIDGTNTKVILRELLRRRNPAFRFKEKAGLFCSVNQWLGEGKSFDKSAWIHAQKQALSILTGPKTQSVPA